MNLKELQDFIKVVAKSGVADLEIETKDLKLKLSTPRKGRNNQPDTIVQQIPMPSFSGMPQMTAPQQQIPTAQQQQQTAQQQTQTAPAAENKEDVEDESKYVTIKAPMVGTFYRKAGPDKDLFVNVGDTIKPGDVVCIVEAMKLFNEIEAEISGKIVKVLVEDASPVEFDQPLFLVDPS